MPAPYARIACFIEEGAASELALAEALSVRAQSPGELHLVHVATPPARIFTGMYASAPPVGDFVAAAERWLAGRAREVPGATPHLLRGWPPRAACEYVARAGVDLLVAAAHRGLVDRAMLGGFAAYVAYHAPCAVLLVHPTVTEDDGTAE